MTARGHTLLITGGRGFIGRAALADIAQTKYFSRIHAVRSALPGDLPPIPGVIWHYANLLEAGRVEQLIEDVKPTHCLHGAWDTSHGSFWTTPANHAWVEASTALAHAFGRAGGQRFISLGSVAEYDWSTHRMIETITPEAPNTLYGQSKLRFHQALMRLAEQFSFSAATGRIFYVYGPYENPHKLIASACRAVIDQKKTQFGPLGLWRDYLHVSDLGRAISALMMSDLSGPVNLGSGEPVRQSRLIETIGRISGGASNLEIGMREDASGDVPILFADTARIRSTGWYPKLHHEEGLATTLAWWRERQRHVA